MLVPPQWGWSIPNGSATNPSGDQSNPSGGGSDPIGVASDPNRVKATPAIYASKRPEKLSTPSESPCRGRLWANFWVKSCRKSFGHFGSREPSPQAETNWGRRGLPARPCLKRLIAFCRNWPQIRRQSVPRGREGGRGRPRGHGAKGAQKRQRCAPRARLPQ